MLEMKRYDNNKWREVVFPVKASDLLHIDIGIANGN